jgi:hypothetical protein
VRVDPVAESAIGAGGSRTDDNERARASPLTRIIRNLPDPGAVVFVEDLIIPAERFAPSEKFLRKKLGGTGAPGDDTRIGDLRTAPRIATDRTTRRTADDSHPARMRAPSGPGSGPDDRADQPISLMIRLSRALSISGQ